MNSPPVPTQGVPTPASVTKITLETDLDVIIMQVNVPVVENQILSNVMYKVCFNYYKWFLQSFSFSFPCQCCKR